MKNFLIIFSLILLFFASCDKEKASLNLIESKDFKVVEIILNGASTNATLTPINAFLRFRDCSSSQNADNDCTLTVELDGSLFSFSYQAQGERNNEFVTIRQGQTPDGTSAEINELLSLMNYTFKIDRTDNTMELSCIDCPAIYQGLVINERLIRLEE